MSRPLLLTQPAFPPLQAKPQRLHVKGRVMLVPMVQLVSHTALFGVGGEVFASRVREEWRRDGHACRRGARMLVRSCM